MSLSKFSQLPDELLDYILNMYWMDKYNIVLDELNNFIRLAKSSNFITQEINLYYIEKFNKEILLSKNKILEKLVENKALRVISLNENINLKWIINLYDGNDINLFKYINYDLRLICSYFVNLSGDYRYHVFYYFTDISKPPDSSVGRAMDCNSIKW